MKKRILCVGFALTLTLLCAACQEKVAPSSESPENSSSASDSEDPSADSEEMIGAPEITTDEKIDASLASFEQNLAESGLTLENKTAKDASSLGALEGYGFQINGKPFEVYLFDQGSREEWSVENLRTAEQSGFITIYGVEINGESPKENCTLNENLVLIFPMEDMFGAHPDKETIVNAFMAIS